MRKTIRCECGFVAEGDDDATLTASACVHARDAHNVDLAPEQILALAEQKPKQPAQRRPVRG
jgi:predicted small metal-binding protein